MRQLQPNPSFPPRTTPHTGAIEWEELPSLAGWLAARQVVLARDAAGVARSFAAAPVWDATRPAEFDPMPPSQPFREPLRGLALREVHEPDVFRHFFGATPGADAALR